MSNGSTPSSSPNNGSKSSNLAKAPHYSQSFFLQSLATACDHRCHRRTTASASPTQTGTATVTLLLLTWSSLVKKIPRYLNYYTRGKVSPFTSMENPALFWERTLALVLIFIPSTQILSSEDRVHKGDPVHMLSKEHQLQIRWKSLALSPILDTSPFLSVS